MAYRLQHNRRLWSRLSWSRLGGRVLLLGLCDTNGILDCPRVVLFWRSCISWLSIRFPFVPLFCLSLYRCGVSCIHPLLARPPEGSCSRTRALSLRGACPPHFALSRLAAGMFNTEGRTPYAFMKFGLCTPCSRHGALPSFPSVKYQQSAIPYVAVVVISCKRRLSVSKRVEGYISE